MDTDTPPPEPLPPPCMAGTCTCPSTPDGADEHHLAEPVRLDRPGPDYVYLDRS